MGFEKHKDLSERYNFCTNGIIGNSISHFYGFLRGVKTAIWGVIRVLRHYRYGGWVIGLWPGERGSEKYHTEYGTLEHVDHTR